MAAIYSNGGNRWNILGFNFTKRDALSSVYNISMYPIMHQILFIRVRCHKKILTFKLFTTQFEHLKTARDFKFCKQFFTKDFPIPADFRNLI